MAEMAKKDSKVAPTVETLKPYLDRGMEEVAKRQARVDAPEEYFRLESFQSRCTPH